MATDSTPLEVFQLIGSFPISRLTTITQADFQNLINDFGTGSATIVINSNLTITSSMTVPANINLVWSAGSIITVNSPAEFTILSAINENNHQIFNVSSQIVALDPTHHVSAQVKLSGTSIILVDWFGAVGDGATDDSNAIQKAINASYKNITAFTSYKIYRFCNVGLGKHSTLDGNGCTIKPYYPASAAVTAMFFLTPSRVSQSKNIYAQDSVQPSEATPAIIENNTIYGFTYDGEQLLNSFYLVTTGYIKYEFIYNITIENNAIRNCSNDPIQINSTQLATKGSSYILNVSIENNEIKWSGALFGVVVTAKALPGALTLAVRSVDGSNVTEKLMIGRLFQLATTYRADADAYGSYANTAAVYRVTSFTPGIGARDTSTLTFGTGTYNPTSGYVDDTVSVGLKNTIIANTWLLPITKYEFPNIYSLPKFSGDNGATTLTRSDTSSVENSFASALYPNLQFQFGVGGALGVYTINAINSSDGSLTITPALSQAVTANRIYALGNMARAIAVGGNTKNVSIYANKLIGGSHGFSRTGYSGFDDNGIGLHVDNNDNYINIENNIMQYNWMHMESQYGTGAACSIRPFYGASVTAGSTTITAPIPGNYRLSSKDVNGDGIAEPCLTGIGTTDANITTANSLFIGDILGFTGVAGRYQIISFPADWTATPTITVARFDPRLKTAIAGGFMNTVAATSVIGDITQLEVRSYSIYTGSSAYDRRYRVHNNQLGDLVRGVAGYHISVGAYELIVSSNDCELISKVSFELSGVYLKMTGNKTTTKPFIEDGDCAPGVPCRAPDGSSLKGVGRLASILASNVLIDSNDFLADVSDLISSYNSCAINLNPENSNIYDRESFIFQNNNVINLGGPLFSTGVSKPSGGINVPLCGYSKFNILNNNIVVAKTATSLGGTLGSFMGITGVIAGNNINTPATTESILAGVFNTELLGAAPYNIIVKNNTCNISITEAIVPYFASVIFDNAKPGNQIVVAKSGTPSTTDLIAEQAGIFKDTVTNRLSIYANRAGTIVDLLNQPTTQITVSGSTGGTAKFSQPASSATYKKVIIYCAALVGTASYTFPVPFINIPVIVSTNGLAASLITTLNTTTVIVTGSTSTGFLLIEGY